MPHKSAARWRKTSRSTGQTACVEFTLAGDWVLVRDSKDPAGTRLRITRAEWLTFVHAVRDGEFLPR
jgi:hypothetical protein